MFGINSNKSEPFPNTSNEQISSERVENLRSFMEERDRRYESRFEERNHRYEQLFKERDDRYEQLFKERDDRYEQRFVAQEIAMEKALSAAERAVDNALQAAKEAVVKAEIATEKRLEGMNEFRGQLTDQATTLMPRGEAESRIKALEEKIDSSAKVSNDKIDVLKTWASENYGKSAGSNQAWGYVVGAVGIIVAIVSRIQA